MTKFEFEKNPYGTSAKNDKTLGYVMGGGILGFVCLIGLLRGCGGNNSLEGRVELLEMQVEDLKVESNYISDNILEAERKVAKEIMTKYGIEPGVWPSKEDVLARHAYNRQQEEYNEGSGWTPEDAENKSVDALLNEADDNGEDEE